MLASSKLTFVLHSFFHYLKRSQLQYMCTMTSMKNCLAALLAEALLMLFFALKVGQCPQNDWKGAHPFYTTLNS